MLRLSVAALALVGSVSAASAQELDAPTVSTQSNGPALAFTLRAGVLSAPDYFGSDSSSSAPTFSGQLNYMRLGGYTFGNPDPDARSQGLSFGGSFRFIGSREAANNPELTGLADVDASLELGAGVRYTTDNVALFGNVRYGVIGHEAFVGELGADFIARPTDRLTLRAGPRLLFGDSDYTATYFGVTAAEETASAGAFTEYTPGGGLVSGGVEIGAAYRVNDNWGIDASINYSELKNDAANSPITQDDKQVSATIGITRRFSLGF